MWTTASKAPSSTMGPSSAGSRHIDLVEFGAEPGYGFDAVDDARVRIDQGVGDDWFMASFD